MSGPLCDFCNDAGCGRCKYSVSDIDFTPAAPVPGTGATGERDNRRALHFSEGKPGVDQIPAEVLIEWGQVFTYGEQKYGRDNWRQGNDWHEFYGSALRHIFAFWGGEDIDPESGMPHLAQAIWNLGALRYFQLHGLGADDRPWLEQEFVGCATDGYERHEYIEDSDDRENALKHIMLDKSWHYAESEPATCTFCHDLAQQRKGEDDDQTEQRQQ